METFQRKSGNQKEALNLLFRQLFIFQDQLEGLTCNSNEQQEEVKEII